MSDVNTMLISAPSLRAELLAPQFNVATSMRLSVLQQAVVAAVGGGPDFPAAAEPLQDGVAYTANDGIAYYRPLLRVGSRGPGMRPGPDVWFLQDDQGAISFQWTLESVPLTGGPAGARPLPITITSVRMVWAPNGSQDFQAPGTDPVLPPADDQPAFKIHGGLQLLTMPEASALESVMNNPNPACRLEVTYTYSYTVQVAQPESDPGPVWRPDRIVRDHRDPRIFGTRREQLLLQPLLARAVADFNPTQLAEVVTPVAEQTVQPVATTAMFAQALAFRAVDPNDAMVARSDVMQQIRPLRLSTAIRDEIDIRAILQPDTRPEARTQTVLRSVPFVFEPADEQNRPIYRSLHDSANLTGDWTLQGEDVGWLRDSDFPNTVFRLPDAMRLAWDPEAAGPRLVPTLYRNAQGDPRVRLLLQLASWQDPNRVVLTRKGIDLPAARVVVGPVDGSTLHLGGAFPEALSVVGGDTSLAINLITGAELALDISLEFYQFFCGLVATPEGLSGTVNVDIGAKPAAGDQPAVPRNVTIPVLIRLDRVSDLPCKVTIPDTTTDKDKLRPQVVTVTNLAGAQISIGGCAGTFLQGDKESVVPVDTYPALCTSTFPITLDPGASTDLTFEMSTPDPDLIWNGVLVELLDKKLTAAPSDILKKVHDRSSSTDVGRLLTVSCPVFQSADRPARWASLISVEVELRVGTIRPVSAVISAANPTRSIDLPATLQDLVQGAPGGITSVGYRVRNNYNDHQGQWTELDEQAGIELVIYPNPAQGD